MCESGAGEDMCISRHRGHRRGVTNKVSRGAESERGERNRISLITQMFTIDLAHARDLTAKSVPDTHTHTHSTYIYIYILHLRVPSPEILMLLWLTLEFVISSTRGCSP